MKIEDLILISVDDHICEPRDMFDGHVPGKYRDQAPKVEVDEHGREQWWYGDLPGRNLGLNATAGKPKDHFNLDACRYDEMRPGCYDVHERVRDMNAGGQLAALNFPNWTGFAGQVLQNGPDRKVNEIMIKAYNDWHVDEWCGAYPDRFIPCGILPLYDAEASAREVRRLAEKGVHAVTFSENPEALQMETIHSEFWYPLWEACVDCETVLCCHLGSSGRGAPTSSDAPPLVTFTLGSVGSAALLGELLWAGFFDRYPNLRFSITEGDIGWMPYYAWRAERVFAQQNEWAQHTYADVSGPGERFRKNILGCFINDPVGPQLIDHFNIDNVMWESDFPHSDSTWPHAPEEFSAATTSLSDDQINKISHLNAMRHFKFDPFAYRGREQCTVAALRAESPDVDVVTHVGRPVEEGEWRRLRSVLRPAPRVGA